MLAQYILKPNDRQSLVLFLVMVASMSLESCHLLQHSLFCPSTVHKCTFMPHLSFVASKQAMNNINFLPNFELIIFIYTVFAMDCLRISLDACDGGGVFMIVHC